jgi:hypothetical protein
MVIFSLDDPLEVCNIIFFLREVTPYGGILIIWTYAWNFIHDETYDLDSIISLRHLWYFVFTLPL